MDALFGAGLRDLIVTLTYELEPTQWSMRVYDSERSQMDYVASALVHVYAGRSWVRQISAPVWLDCLLENLTEILAKLGVEKLEGAMNPAMERYLTLKCKGRGVIETEGPVECSDRVMNWVSLRACEAGADALSILRQKEQQMAKKTLKLVVEITDETGAVDNTNTLVWNGLDYQRLCFLEKHLIGALANINAEAAKLVAAQ